MYEEEVFNECLELVLTTFNKTREDVIVTNRKIKNMPAKIALTMVLYNNGLTFEKIGLFCGKKDHTTIVHHRDKFNDYDFTYKFLSSGEKLEFLLIKKISEYRSKLFLDRVTASQMTITRKKTIKESVAYLKEYISMGRNGELNSAILILLEKNKQL